MIKLCFLSVNTHFKFSNLNFTSNLQTGGKLYHRVVCQKEKYVRRIKESAHIAPRVSELTFSAKVGGSSQARAEVTFYSSSHPQEEEGEEKSNPTCGSPEGFSSVY